MMMSEYAKLRFHCPKCKQSKSLPGSSATLPHGVRVCRDCAVDPVVAKPSLWSRFIEWLRRDD